LILPVQQVLARQAHGFGDGTLADLAIPSRDDLLSRFSTCQRIQYLPHHYARALKRRFAVADLWVNDDVLAQLGPLRGTPISAVSHGPIVRVRVVRFKPTVNLRDNDLETGGWKLLRFNTSQLNDQMTEYCVPAIVKNIERLGGLAEDRFIPRDIQPDPAAFSQMSLFDDQSPPGNPS
jgi:hypothetical protein